MKFMQLLLYKLQLTLYNKNINKELIKGENYDEKIRRNEIEGT